MLNWNIVILYIEYFIWYNEIVGDNMHDENLELLFNNKDKDFFIDIINNSFPSFKELLTNKFIRFNKLDSFVPQGVCSVLDYTIVSLYDSDFEFCSKLSI